MQTLSYAHCNCRKHREWQDDPHDHAGQTVRMETEVRVGGLQSYLEDYYKDIKRWSFPMEVFFLKERFKDLLEIRQSKESVVQDRSIYEGVYVFTENNYAMGNLDDRDYETYMELFEDMTDAVRFPDLMIYLRSSVSHLVSNIEKRGREYEQKMPLDYLESLNRRYDEFIRDKYKGRVLTIDVDKLDYQHQPKDFGFITDKIDRALFGLF